MHQNVVLSIFFYKITMCTILSTDMIQSVSLFRWKIMQISLVIAVTFVMNSWHISFLIYEALYNLLAVQRYYI